MILHFQSHNKTCNWLGFGVIFPINTPFQPLKVTEITWRLQQRMITWGINQRLKCDTSGITLLTYIDS